MPGPSHSAKVNAQYNLAAPESLANRIATRQRRKMFADFVGGMNVSAADTLLDVGATTDRLCEHSNYVEAWWAHKDRITAIGITIAGSSKPSTPASVSFGQMVAVCLSPTTHSISCIRAP
jgi:hypothetical protein